MLVFKIEMWPGGDEKRKFDLGGGRIWRVSGDEKHRDYRVELFKSKHLASRIGLWRYGFIKYFDFRKRGPYDLLYRALSETVGKINLKANKIFESTIDEMEKATEEPLDDISTSPTW